eukprot:tig00020563_g11293.t1
MGAAEGKCYQDRDCSGELLHAGCYEESCRTGRGAGKSWREASSGKCKNFQLEDENQLVGAEELATEQLEELNVAATEVDMFVDAAELDAAGDLFQTVDVEFY